MLLPCWTSLFACGRAVCESDASPYAGIPVGQASIGLLIFIAFFLVAAVFTGMWCTAHIVMH